MKKQIKLPGTLFKKGGIVAILILLSLGCSKEIKPWKFGVLADNRGGNRSHREVLYAMKKDGVEVIINLGDIVHPKKGCHWSDFMTDMQAVYGSKLKNISKKYFLTAGGWEEQYINQHQRPKDPKVEKKDWKYKGKYKWWGYEPDNKAGQQFYKNYFKYKERAGKKNSLILDYDSIGDYYAKYKNLHILSLYITDEWHEEGKFWPDDNPEERKKAWKKQVEWLEGHLKNIRKNYPDAVIAVIGHDRHWMDKKDDSFEGQLSALLKKYKVELAMCGDAHEYKHYPDPITLKFMATASLTKGKGGYFLVTVDGRNLTLENCNDDGMVLDTFRKITE